MEHGIRICIFLFTLFAVISGLLIWLRIPRPLVFAIVWLSAAIYAFSFFVGLGIVDRVNQDLVEGFVPYFIPLPFVATYIGWALRRHYKTLGHERTQV